MARRRQQRNWREELKDLFAMHRGERRGFTVLLGFCIIAAGWVTWEQWIRPRTMRDGEELKIAWRKFQSDSAGHKPFAKRSLAAITPFDFNPNGLSMQQWVRLGLSEKQAASIHRFEEQGGRFRTKADLARMRVVDPDLFALWEPYIKLPDSLPRREWQRREWDHGTKQETTTKPSWTAHRNQPERTLVELNTADSTALVAVRGIGPSFARSILRYRDRLGGYASLDQLSEVPILRNKPDAVDRLKSLLSVDPGLLHLIPLNTCTAEDLGPHPYIGWKVAKALVAYRHQHGPFKALPEIKGCALVTDSILVRITPYLTLEQ
jgi:DNA uptake protein ComE-like DNA-binding protein